MRNNKASIITVVLVILMVFALFLAGRVFYLFQNERAKNSSLQLELDNLTAQYRKAESELEGAKKNISSLQLNLRDTQDRAEAINNELQQEKAAKQEALSQMEQLRIELEEEKKLESDLEAKLNQANEGFIKTQDQLKVLASQKAELETKIKELEAKPQGVELGKIVVTPEPNPSAEVKEQPGQPAQAKKEKGAGIAGQEGKVLVVNKDYDFIVINLGSKDGVGIGDMFSVYHNNKNLGEVKIEKVHDSMAAAGFISEDIKNKVNEGDKIIQKVK